MGIIEKKKDQLARKRIQIDKLQVTCARLEYEITNANKTEEKYKNYREKYENRKKSKGQPLEREEEKKGFFEELFSEDE